GSPDGCPATQPAVAGSSRVSTRVRSPTSSVGRPPMVVGASEPRHSSAGGTSGAGVEYCAGSSPRVAVVTWTARLGPSAPARTTELWANVRPAGPGVTASETRPGP